MKTDPATAAAWTALADKVGPTARLPEPPLPDGISEKDFMARVIRYAESRGWLVYHVHFSQCSKAGFPDLVMVRDRLIFAELKADKGVPTDEQLDWLERLKVVADGTEKIRVLLWVPQLWKRIQEVLA